MAIIHQDLSVLINTTKWWVLMKDGFEDHVPGYYKKYPERQPLYKPMTDRARSSVTIHQIVEYCNDNVEFAVEDRDDLLQIIGFLQEYYNQISKMVEGLADNHPHKIYSKKCKIALACLREFGDIQEKITSNKSTFHRAPNLVEILKRM